MNFKEVENKITEETITAKRAWEIYQNQNPFNFEYSYHIGYLALIKYYDLQVLPNYCFSNVVQEGTINDLRDLNKVVDGIKWSIHILSVNIFDLNPLWHLKFAFENEGINLEIISNLYSQETFDVNMIVNAIRNDPQDPTVRRLWFLYEYFTSNILDVEDISGTVLPIELLDSRFYYTSTNKETKRQGVYDNLLGNKHFCPMIRRTTTPDELDGPIDGLVQLVTRDKEESLLARVALYLFTEDTKASFSIERALVKKDKIKTFYKILLEYQGNLFTKEGLCELCSKFHDDETVTDYRNGEVVIASEWTDFIGHIGARQKDVEILMEGLLASYNSLINEVYDPIVLMTTICFGFVNIHPFNDGNGRSHRFLMQYILKNYLSTNIIVPISVHIYKNETEYRNLLRSYSKKVMNLISYDRKGFAVDIKSNTYGYYAYFDATDFFNYLKNVVESSIILDMKKELEFMEKFDLAVNNLGDELRNIDANIIKDIISLCLNNIGCFPSSKMNNFPTISKDQLKILERVAKELYQEKIKK